MQYHILHLHDTNIAHITTFLHDVKAGMQGKYTRGHALCIEAFGMIQGVGFRPFVATLAHTLCLHGMVCNQSSSVAITLHIDAKDLCYIESVLLFLMTLILACGNEIDATSLNDFTHILHKALRLKASLNVPQKAFIQSLQYAFIASATYREGFHILSSKSTHQAIQAYIPPDMKICESCLKDMRNKDSRFYNYPFVACVNCGARYSIIYRLPYDRRNTSMRDMQICKDCAKDYASLHNRRFHTEPISCNHCAIEVEFYRYHTKATSQQCERSYGIDALQSLAKALMHNKVILFKGLGGFAYIANARSSEAVKKIREMKAREHKPFVVMAELHTLEHIALLSEHIKDLLVAQEAPIVIAPKHIDYNLSDEVSSLQTIGVMIPYTAMLHILFSYLPDGFALIYTSANNKGEMMATSLETLDLKRAALHTGELYILDYSREILHLVDDSILLGIDIESMPTKYLDSTCSLHLDSNHDGWNDGFKMQQIQNLESTTANHANNTTDSSSCSMALEALAELEDMSYLSNNDYSSNSLKRSNCIDKGEFLRNLESIHHNAAQINLHSLKARAMRVSRGFTPLHITSNRLYLKAFSVAFGAVQKSSLSFGFKNHIAVSPYLGDLFTAYNIANFRKTFDYFSAIYGRPQALIADRHNQYISTQIAKEVATTHNIPLFQVSHHHAHFNALLLESGVKEGVGAIFDGSGLGDDGTLWGGEFLHGDSKHVKRLLHFKPFKILGGEGHIKDCKRLAYSYALCNNITQLQEFIESSYATNEIRALQMLYNMNVNAILCSSVGRLFDIAGFILGLDRLSYEAQSGEMIASLALQCVYDDIAQKYQTLTYDALMQTFYSKPYKPYPFAIAQGTIDMSECILSMFKERQAGQGKDIIASRFIDTLAYCILEALQYIGADYVLCGGGVFANYALCIRVKTLLNKHGMQTFFPRLPSGDYSLSIGQLMYLQHFV